MSPAYVKKTNDRRLQAGPSAPAIRLARVTLIAGLLVLLLAALSPHWSASATLWTVDDSFVSDTGTQRMTIQRAVDNATNGDTIVVNAGTYTEYVIVNKTLTIQGNPRNSTLVSPGYAGAAFSIEANNVNISALTIQQGDRGIYIAGPYSKLSVLSVTFEALSWGVYVESAANVSVNTSYFGNTSYAVYSYYGFNTFAANNTFFQNFLDVEFDYTNGSVARDGNHSASYYGVYLYSAWRATVDRNHMGNSTSYYGRAVSLSWSGRTTVSSNRIDNYTGPGYGIFLEWSSDSTIVANDLSDVGYPFTVTPYESTDGGVYNHSITPTNKADGKSVYYYVNTTNVTVPSNAGWIGAFNVTGLTIPFQNITRARNAIWLDMVSNVSVAGLNVSTEYGFAGGWALYLAFTSNVTVRGLNISVDVGALYGDYATSTTIKDSRITHETSYNYYSIQLASSPFVLIQNVTFDLNGYSPFLIDFSDQAQIIGNSFDHTGSGYLEYAGMGLIKDNSFNSTYSAISIYGSWYGRMFNNSLTNSSSPVQVGGNDLSHYQWDIANNNTWEGRRFRSYVNASNFAVQANLSWLLLTNVTNVTASYFDPNNQTGWAGVVAYSNNVTFRNVVANWTSGLFIVNSRFVTVANFTGAYASYAAYVTYSSDVTVSNVNMMQSSNQVLYVYYTDRTILRNVSMSGVNAYTGVYAFGANTLLVDNITVTETASVAQLYSCTFVTVNRATSSWTSGPWWVTVQAVYSQNVSGLNITNSSFTNLQWGLYLESWTNNWNILLRNVSFINVSYGGVWSNDPGSGNLTFDGGSITGVSPYSSTAYGVYLESLTGPIVIRGVTIQWFRTGVFIDPMNNVTVENNTISGVDWGVQFATVTDSAVRSNTISNTVIGGIEITNSVNVTADSNNVQSPGIWGFRLTTDVRLNVTNNTVNGGVYGFLAEGGGSSTFTSNFANGTSTSGIQVAAGHQNSTFTSNTVTNSLQYGFFINQVSYLTLVSNAMSGSAYNFRIDATAIGRFYHTIPPSNTVNAKPIYFLVNQTGGTVPTTAGVAILANCTGTLVSGLTVDHNWHGVLLFQSTGITVLSVTAGTTRYGIEARLLTNSNLQDNVIDGSEIGIQLVSSNNNTLVNNAVNASTLEAILLSSSNLLTVTSNRISNSSFIGLFISAVSGGNFTSNTMTNDVYAFYLQGSVLAQYNHSLGPSNTINGVPIFFRLNTTDVVVPANVSAVILANVTNATVANLALNHSYFAVDLFGSTNITVSNVTVDVVSVGIHTRSSTNVTIQRSAGSRNTYLSYLLQLDAGSRNLVISDLYAPAGTVGIYFVGAGLANISVTNATFGDIAFSRNMYYGIYMSGSIDNVTVSSSNWSYTQYGAWLQGPNPLQRVTNVTIANSTFDRFIGVAIANVQNSFVENVTFYHNNIHAGGSPPSDTGGIIRWYRDYPVGGNWWSNWTTPDDYGTSTQAVPGPDGIVDMPFDRTYTHDQYPLVDPWPPQVSLTAPANNSIIAQGTALDFYVPRYFDSATYAINNASAVAFVEPFDISTGGWADGDYHIWVNATDATGVSDSRWFFVTIDSTAPSIAATVPTPGTIVAPGTNLEYLISDAHLALNATWDNGSGPVLFASQWKFSTLGWVDGDYTVTVTAWDAAGNMAQSSFAYGVDGFGPTVTAVSPANNSQFPAGRVVDLAVVDPHFANASWDNGSGANTLAAPFDIDTTGWADGPVSITVFANDSVGHQTTRRFDFVVDSTAPAVTVVAPANNSVIQAGTTLDFLVVDANLATVVWSNGGAYSAVSAPYDISTAGWADGGFTVRVNATDMAGNFRNASFGFTLDSTKPAIVLNSPGNGSVSPAGTTMDFSITDANFANATWNRGTGPNAFVAPFDISTAGWADGPYDVTVIANDLAGNSKTSVFSIVIDSTAPVITLNAPSNGSYIVAGTLIDLSIADANLLSASWNNGTATIAFSSPFDISTAGWADGDYTVRVDAMDSAFNSATPLMLLYHVDSAAPAISIVSPANGSVGVPGTVLNLAITDLNAFNATWNNGSGSNPLGSPFDISTSGWADGSYDITINASDVAGNVRFFLMRFTVDSVAPTVLLLAPANGAFIVAGTSLDLSVADAHLGTVLWSNGGAYSSLSTPYDISTSGWADGSVTVRINATDLAGNFVNVSYSFTVDSTLPSVAVNSPANNSYLAAGVTLDFAVADANLNTVLWSNGGAFAVLAAPYDISTSTWPDGPVTVRINATDLAGNFVNASFSFTVDSTAPSVSLTSPANNTHLVAGTVIDFAVSDTNLDSVLWSNGGAYSALASPYDLNTTGWADGTYQVRINATDLAGNFRNVTVTFTVDSTGPSVVYNGPFGSLYWNGAIVLRAGTTLDFGITDANLNTTTWTNGSGPNPLSSPFDIATTGWADGAYTVVVSSTDLAGNPGSGTIQLIIDSTFPVWTFVAPGNASTVVAGAVLQFDLAEMHPTAANWSNGGAPVAFTPQWDNATGVVSGTTYSVNTAGWVDAVYTLTLSARDASGNVVVAIYSLSIDSTGPTITLASPPNDSVVTPGTVLIFDIVESSLASATWSTGGAPSNFTTPFNLSTAGWADGSYNVTVRAADRAGNAAVEVFHMIVDGTPPVIRTPLWNNSYGDAGTSLLISIQEDNPQSLTANLGRGPVSSTGLFVVVGTTGLPEGAYNVSVTAVDQAGHTANATFRFIVDSTGPVIHSVTPANGSFVRPGVLITFSVTESNLLNVTWRRNGGALLPANGSGPFTIDTSLWADFNNTVLLIARDRVDHLAIFVLILVTDSQPPTLPAFLANYSYDEDLTVPFDASASSDGANPLNASSVVWNFSARLSALMVGFFVNYTWDTPGNYTVVLTVTDAAGNVNSILLGVRVLDTTPPTANAGPDTTADEDGPFMLDGSASGDNDPDAAANLRYSWTQTAGPAVSLDATSPTPSITPTTPGMYAFELTVTDGAGLSDTDSVQIAVRDITPPALPALVFPVYNEGATVLFNASGTTDNDVANQSQVVFVWTFVDGSLFEIDAITGSHVFATPGLYTINLTAYDVSGNRASVLLPLRINDIPGLATMPPTDFELPGIYEVTLDITDDDAGDTHNVTVQSPPTMTVVTLGGKPALRFDPGSFGMYWVNFTISDGWSSVNFSVLLTVTSPVTGNRPPAFTTEPVLEATSSRQYSYLAQATDPDGDRLVYGLDVFPAGMTVNEVTGAINWPHGYTASSGNHFDNVSFWVWDGAHFVYQNFTIRFLAAGNAPPVIADGFLTAVSVKNGTAYTYPNPAEFVTDGNDGLASLIFNITVADPSIATATLQGTGGATEIRYVGLRVGTTTATLRVRDPSGAVATKSIQVTVEPVGASAPNTDAFSGFLLPLLLAAGAAGGAAFFIVMRRKKGQNAEVLTPSAPAQAVHVAPEVVAVAPPVVRARPSAVSLGREAAAAAAAASPATVPAVAPGEKKITYTIEGLFVIYKDGRLLYSKTDMGQAKFEDPELVSSMFTAVQSFIKDSFQAEGELNKMGYGDNQVIIERGNHIFVAAIVYGEPDLEFMDGVRAAIEGIELSYAGIIEGWDGMMDHFSDMDQKLAPVAALTAGITRREVQLATTKQEVLMLSELEFFQGFVRLKVGIKNNTASVITKATVDIEYNEDVLRLARVEPAAYRTSGAKVLLGVLNPAEKSSVAYYFDPQICTESQIDGVCRYRDATGVLHTVSMKTRKAEVVCPLFFTKEHANTAMLKRLVESELNEKDAKVFEIQKMPPYIKYKDVFDLIKSVVNAHDVQQVREFTKYNPFQGEAWFYGETKVKGYKIVIRASVIEEGTSIEFFAASTNMKAITGLLAEFNHTLNSMVIEKYSDLKIALTFDAEKKAEIEKKSLMSAMGSAELEGGETEQPGGGEGAPPPDPGA